MRSSKYLPKIGTIHGQKFWTGAYAHQRAKLLRLAGVPEAQVAELAGLPYDRLSAEVKYSIDTCGATEKDLA